MSNLIVILLPGAQMHTDPALWFWMLGKAEWPTPITRTPSMETLFHEYIMELSSVENLEINESSSRMLQSIDTKL